MVMSGNLANLLMSIQVDAGPAGQTLRKFQTDAQRTGNVADQSAAKARSGFGRLGDSLKTTAGRVPILGGALAQLVTPVGAATAAIGLTVGVLAKSVTGVTNLERELRPMIARSGIAAEGLQVLTKVAERLGSEDGLEGVTDSAQELQLRLAEAVQDGTGPAVAAFEKLGLSSEELINKSPEESFLAVLTALQGVTNEADKKFLADELLGGSSEKLAGVINAEAGEFQALTSDIKENANIVSNEAVASAGELNAAFGRLKEGAGGVTTAIGTALIPVITGVLNVVEDIIPVLRDTFTPIWDALVDVWKTELQPALTDVFMVMRDDVLPALQDIWTAISPVPIPVVKVLIGLFGNQLRATFGIVAGVIKTVAAILTGDFSRAWEGLRDIAFSVMRGIIGVYNATLAKLPGFAKVDMAAVEEAFGRAEDAATDTGEAMETAATGTIAAGKAAADATPPITAMGNAAGDAADKVETYADRLNEAREELIKIRQEASETALFVIDLALSFGSLEQYTGEVPPTLAEIEARLKATEEAADRAAEAIRNLRDANREFVERQNEQQGLTQSDLLVAQSQFNQLSGSALSDLLAEAEELGIDPVRLLAQQRKIEQQDRAHYDVRLRELRQFDDRLQRVTTDQQRFLLHEYRQYLGNAEIAQHNGNQQEFDIAVSAATRLRDEILSQQDTTNRERVANLEKLRDELQGVETETGKQLLASVEQALVEINTAQTLGDDARYTNALAGLYA